MRWLTEEMSILRGHLGSMTLYQRFEHVIILILTALIMIVVTFAIWYLALKILSMVIFSTFDPTD